LFTGSVSDATELSEHDGLPVMGMTIKGENTPSRTLAIDQV
jgi:hypothetical protein